MNDEISYAEMLEIPVETVTVSKKEKKKKWREEPLSDQLVKEVNDRMEASDPAYAESKPIEREMQTVNRRSPARKVLLVELVAVIALCATIFLTNLFIPNSAINTFVRGLFQGNAQTADARVYSDFKLSPVVNEYVDAEVTVSETGVMSFTAECTVYAPVEGTLESVYGNATDGYSIRLRHSDSFTTIISGIDDVYLAEGDKVRTNVPLAHSDGEGAVSIMFYDGENLIRNVVKNDEGISWS